MQTNQERGMAISEADQVTFHNANTIWSRAITATMARAGVDQVIVCPGGRAASMALSLATQAGVTVRTMNDERAAGFFALGLARWRGRPVAVCTTSGSAVANLLPALLEAEALAVPILVLTCDRPVREHGGGGPQFADHLSLCQAVTRRQVALGEPVVSEAALIDLQDRLGGFLADWLADETMPGPAQINLPFHGALSALDLDSQEIMAPIAKEIFDRALVSGRDASPDASEPIEKVHELRLPANPKGLIVVGSDCPFETKCVVVCAERTGFPVFADAASGLRRPIAIKTLVAESDLLCNSLSAGRMAPDIILQIGKAPDYHGTHRFLKRQTCPVVILDRAEVKSDFLGRAFVALGCGDGVLLPAIADAIGPGDAEWARVWLEAGAGAAATVDEVVRGLAWGEVSAAMAICNAEGFAMLHLGNSMPVRLGNLLCRPSKTPQRIFANRGVNGIDGTIATFLGELAEAPGPGLAVMGDLAFSHDLSALELVHQIPAAGAICVMQNYGGAIFDFLPGQDLPHFADAIRNPRPLDIAPLAAAFGLPYHHVIAQETLAAALTAARSGDTLHLIEIDVPPQSARDGLRMLFLSTQFH